MNPWIGVVLLSVLLTWPLGGQVSTLIPTRARDSLIASDARSATAGRDRQRNLDSLAAGQKRWALAHVSEYEFQVHTECFCHPVAEDSASRFPLATIRAGVIVARAPGRPVRGIFKNFTIDSVFARVEADLRDPGRVVRRLDLDPRYGFPREYFAETPSIADLWLRFHVDSFAVKQP